MKNTGISRNKIIHLQIPNRKKRDLYTAKLRLKIDFKHRLSAPVRWALVASPVEKFAGIPEIVSPVPNYASTANK